jgi:hypothetical protein
MTIRPATLTTDQVTSCPNLKTAAEVVYYSARIGYAGADHLVYQISSPNGAVDTFDVTITVKEAPRPPLPGDGQKL